MALIKCSECGQEVSTEAKICPHCGRPNLPIVVERFQSKKETWKAVTGFIILGLVFAGLYFWSGGIPLNLKQNVLKNVLPQTQQQTSTQSGQAIPLQEVKNLGYDFYVGQIDSANTTNITDDLKNQITKIAYDSHIPTNLLKNVPIIILNNLALTGDQYIPAQGGNLKVPDLKPDFLSEGGLYVTFNNGLPVIFINKPIIAQGNLVETLTHELGHAVGSKLTDQDWIKFYQLRGIPIGTPREGTSWNLSPQEDFAEVYKYTFTGIAVRTYYGLLMPNGNYEDLLEGNGMSTCGKIYIKIYSNYLQQFQKPNTCTDWSCLGQTPVSPTTAQISQAKNIANTDETVQSCRRDVLMNPSKYPSDWTYETPYKASVSQATKDFIVSIANRLNQQ